ncbi:hypothetical protein HS088_TW03G00764 [Tripterygium wilfordii]|uniref:Nodulin-like domain-containing protein n=1 Tax=Tripterygium wilfordii TaxID=458696 RepID=A0A7J7DVN7_TRIWF|nr:uncharacterized protein LOC119995632 [Tripterygium wilfordii]KAF5750428.1 hypothetical protein HS088_TW03G00764 [Tripterygium wilfordii]
MAESNGCDYSGFWRQTRNFGLQILVSRWFMLFASLLIMSVNGTGYMFGIYSGDIKSSLGYDQTTLNTIGFFKDLGGNLGVLPGLIYEVTPPWMVLSIGSVMNFFGNFMIWLAVTGRISKPHVWQMFLYICIAANSQSFPNTAALVTCVKNFPESRGSVIGLLKGFIGLSGAIITQLYHAIYGDDSKALILFIACLPTVVPLVFLRMIRIMKVVRCPGELKVFYNFLYIALGLAGFMMIIIVVQNRTSFTRTTYSFSALVVLILLFLPIAIVIKEELNSLKIKDSAENLPPPAAAAAEAATEETLGADSCLINIFNPPQRGEDYTILQAIFSIDMLIIFTATTCGVGGALAAIDNLGQIGSSLGYPKHSIATFISLVSIWNFLGRVLAGFVSESLLTKYNFPRPLMLSLVILLASVGHLLIAFAVPNSLYLNSIIMGFCLGAQLPLVSTIISEIFGLKHYSTLYNVGSVSSPVGSYIFNVKVAGKLYDREALKQMKGLGLGREAGKALNCSGVECYKMGFVIISVATLFGFLVSLVLVIRTRKFYNGDIYKRFREDAIATAEINTGNNVVPARSVEASANPAVPNISISAATNMKSIAN